MDLNHCPCSGVNLPRLIQPVILGVLAQGPLHGYLLVRQLAEMESFQESPPDPAGIYRLLKKMERDEVLCSSWELDDGPARKTYAITEKGRHCLGQWICSLRSHQSFLAEVLLFLQKSTFHQPLP